MSDIQTHIKRCSCTTAANHIAAYYSEQSHLKALRLYWERDIKRLDKQFLAWYIHRPGATVEVVKTEGVSPSCGRCITCSTLSDQQQEITNKTKRVTMSWMTSVWKFTIKRTCNNAVSSNIKIWLLASINISPSHFKCQICSEWHTMHPIFAVCYMQTKHSICTFCMQYTNKAQYMNTVSSNAMHTTWC